MIISCLDVRKSPFTDLRASCRAFGVLRTLVNFTIIGDPGKIARNATDDNLSLSELSGLSGRRESERRKTERERERERERE